MFFMHTVSFASLETKQRSGRRNIDIYFISDAMLYSYQDDYWQVTTIYRRPGWHNYVEARTKFFRYILLLFVITELFPSTRDAGISIYKIASK